MLNTHIINKLKELATPYYFYDMELLKATLSKAKAECEKHNFILHYALKANSNIKILKTIESFGIGADCVSGNEILQAINCGFDVQKIVFAGVGKSDDEINIGIDNNIFCFNCESIQEMEVINQFAKQKNKVIPIAIRINPNIDAHTHHYITTGLEENKFGVDIHDLDSIIEQIRHLQNLKLIAIHFHIGSQITDMSVFQSLCQRVNEIQTWFESKNIKLEHVNVGGGLGVSYESPCENPVPDFETYFNTFKNNLHLRPHQKLHFELGRSLIAQCGNLLTKVLYIKKGINTNFIIVDAGMTELLRPALYQAYHKMENISSKLAPKLYDVVGPICESSDCFGKAQMLTQASRGDFIIIRTAGAYGEVMASQYNLRNLPKRYYSDELK